MPTFLKSHHIEEVRTAYYSPWQNPYCERVIGILRRELLDYIIPLNERHLHRLLKEYIYKYYNPVRTHSSLGLRTRKRTSRQDSLLRCHLTSLQNTRYRSQSHRSAAV
ncbi:transposase [bacterium]|nr:transposase [bacterium]